MNAARVTTFDPRTGDAEILSVGESTEADVDAAAQAAHDARDWLANLPPIELSRLLSMLASGLEANRDELVATADKETALGSTRLNSELTRTIYQFQLFAAECASGALFDATIDRSRDDTPIPRPDLRRMNVGIGVVAVFSASNFPFAFSVPGTDTASALAARCPVVVKGHSAHPQTSLAAHRILEKSSREAGAPAGLIGLVLGRAAGTALTRHPAISAIAFTGSQAGGIALQRIASERPDPIPFYGELGGINPVIISAAALIERSATLAAGVLDSAFLGMGQFCTKPGLVLVEAGSEFEQFKDDLRISLTGRPGGALLASRIRDSFRDSISQWEEFDGVEVIPTGAEAAPGWYARPYLVLATAQSLIEHSQLTEECFGPVTVVTPFGDHAELVAVLEKLEPALTATIHLAADDSHERAIDLRDRLAPRAGRLIFNGFPTGVAVSRAQHHGGPWPSTTNSLYSSVGLSAAKRFLRPVAYQGWPQELLPLPLADANPWGVPQVIDDVIVASRQGAAR